MENISDNPLVSIAIPTFNRMEKLKVAIDSVLRQSYNNLEVIISDNTSTDLTLDICTSYQAQDCRVRYFRQDRNIGAVANFEFAKHQAHGKYFMWLADDDYIDAEFIAHCVRRLEIDTSAVLAAGATRFVSDGIVKMIGKAFETSARSRVVRIFSYFFCVTDNSTFYGLQRVSIIKDCVMPNVLGGDWIWMAEVLLHGRVVVEPKAILTRSVGGASVSYKSIFRSLGYPDWWAFFPRFTLLIISSHYLAFRSDMFDAVLGRKKYIVAILSAFACAMKWGWFFVRKVVVMISRAIPVKK